MSHESCAPRYRLYTSRRSYSLPWRFSNDDSLDRLEREICKRFDVAAAVCVPMARTGLYLTFCELIRPGQRVVMSPLTIIDIVNAVLLAGGIPVFGDIDPESCGLDPNQAESLIDGNTGAVLITHLHGGSAGAQTFRDICRRRGAPLIEDTAQAFGAVECGRRLGTIGDAGIYSFGFYKNVNAWRGGIVVSQNSSLIDRISRRVALLPVLSKARLLAASLRGLITDLATRPRVFGTVTHPVFRYAILHDVELLTGMLDAERGMGRVSTMPSRYMDAMSSTQASIALSQLDRVDVDSRTRIEHARRYDEGLGALKVLKRRPQNGDLSHIYTSYPIRVQDRDQLLRYAQFRWRDFGRQVLRNCADLPDFAELRRDCPNARAAAHQLVLLPTYPRYPIIDIERNIDVIQKFFRKK